MLCLYRVGSQQWLNPAVKLLVLTAGGARAPEQALRPAMGAVGTRPSLHTCVLSRTLGLSPPPDSDCFLVFSHLQPSFLASRQLSQLELAMNRPGR